ncbi:MAG TPA: sugar ABC transporter substrate-binding protein [Candidatus Scybalocola faecavium]|nr:sugar ABC transporter substrate-binding protein [Candidatus Scybalocola faecavium]
MRRKYCPDFGGGGTSDSNVAGSEASGESQAADNGNSGEKITIRLTNWGTTTDGEADQQLIDEFNETNDKNIEVVFDLVPSEGYGDRLTTSFSSGDGYDIFASGEGDFFKWVDRGLTMPMDDMMAADSDYTQTLPDSLMNMGKVNGQQQYMVIDYNPICLYYNKDMFDAAGMEYPTSEWTWDDLFDAAAQLTVKNDDGTYEQYGFNAQNWAYAVLTYLESLGLNLMNEDGTECDGYLNSPEVAEALDRYFAMAEEPDKVSPASADLDTFGSATAMMTAGKLAMFVSGGWDKVTLDEAGTNYGMALIPGNHTSYLCASGYAIGANCKHPEAAWEVIKFLTSEHASDVREEVKGVLPTSEDKLSEAEASLDDTQKAFVETLDYSVQPIGLRSALGSKINEKTGDIFENIIFHTSDTQTILDNAVQEIKSEMAEE